MESLRPGRRAHELGMEQGTAEVHRAGAWAASCFRPSPRTTSFLRSSLPASPTPRPSPPGAGAPGPEENIAKLSKEKPSIRFVNKRPKPAGYPEGTPKPPPPARLCPPGLWPLPPLRRRGGPGPSRKPSPERAGRSPRGARARARGGGRRQSRAPRPAPAPGPPASRPGPRPALAARAGGPAAAGGAHLTVLTVLTEGVYSGSSS